MQTSEFISTVQAMAGIDSQQSAARAVQATFETLAERIVGNEASQLAAQLPEDLAQYLRGHEGDRGESFSLKEFYQRVADREGLDPGQAAIHIRAVMTTLSAAVSDGEFEDVRLNLPPDYQELFAPGRDQ